MLGWLRVTTFVTRHKWVGWWVRPKSTQTDPCAALDQCLSWVAASIINNYFLVYFPFWIFRYLNRFRRYLQLRVGTRRNCDLTLEYWLMFELLLIEKAGADRMWLGMNIPYPFHEKSFFVLATFPDSESSL